MIGAAISKLKLLPPAFNLPTTLNRQLSRLFRRGNYTAIVEGVNGTTGVALVEVYGLN